MAAGQQVFDATILFSVKVKYYQSIRILLLLVSCDIAFIMPIDIMKFSFDQGPASHYAE